MIQFRSVLFQKWDKGCNLPRIPCYQPYRWGWVKNLCQQSTIYQVRALLHPRSKTQYSWVTSSLENTDNKKKLATSKIKRTDEQFSLILTKKMKLKKQRKYLAHLDIQPIVANWFVQFNLKSEKHFFLIFHLSKLICKMYQEFWFFFLLKFLILKNYFAKCNKNLFQ